MMTASPAARTGRATPRPPTWWRRLRRLGRETCGQALVEFAVASIVYFMTLFGTISFGMAVYQYNGIADLAQEGARWAAVRGSSVLPSLGTQATNDSVQSYVRGRALGSSVTVTTTWPSGGSPSNSAGKRVRVLVTKSFTPFTSLIPNASLSLQSTAEMIIAR